MVRIGKEESGVGGFLKFFVSMELSAVVDGDGVDAFRVSCDELSKPAIRRGDGPVVELANHEEAGFPFDERDNAGPGIIGTHDGVAFPVSDSGTVSGPGRPVVDSAFTAQFPAGIGTSVPLASLLPGLSEEPIESAALLSVLSKVGVDGFATDEEQALLSQRATDLLRAEAFPEQPDDAAELGFVELAVASGPGTPGLGVLDGFVGPVGTVMGGGVTTQFPADGAGATAQEPGNLRLRPPLRSASSERISLF